MQFRFVLHRTSGCLKNLDHTERRGTSSHTGPQITRLSIKNSFLWIYNHSAPTQCVSPRNNHYLWPEHRSEHHKHLSRSRSHMSIVMTSLSLCCVNLRVKEFHCFLSIWRAWCFYIVLINYWNSSCVFCLLPLSRLENIVTVSLQLFLFNKHKREMCICRTLMNLLISLIVH